MPRLIATFLFASALATSSPTLAQEFDPRLPLANLISAFQNCGPPQIYQMLSPQLFQAVAAQTNGTGCYAQIAQAGTILSMDLIDQREFPNGTVYVIRVAHRTGVADWFMGISRFTSQIDYLSFQTASGPPPSVMTGPSPIRSVGPSQVDSAPRREQPDGCELYPSMC